MSTVYFDDAEEYDWSKDALDEDFGGGLELWKVSCVVTIKCIVYDLDGIGTYQDDELVEVRKIEIRYSEPCHRN